MCDEVVLGFSLRSCDIYVIHGEMVEAKSPASLRNDLSMLLSITK